MGKRVKCAVFPVLLLLPFIPSSLDVRCNHLGSLLNRSRHILAPESSSSCLKLPSSARAGRVSAGKPLWCGAAATAADAAVTAIRVDAGGASKCAQRARVAHEGRHFKIKATIARVDAWIFL